MIDDRSLSQLAIAETPLAIFDLETTGRSKNYAEIVEASVVRIEPGQPPQLAFDSLIKPRGSVKCSEIHHIYADHVREAPEWDEVAPAIADALSGAVWVAYNVYFDLGFTQKAFARTLGYDVEPAYLCAANLRSLLKIGPRGRLSAVCEQEGIHFKDGQHIAVYDTWMTARLMQVWLSRMHDLGLKHYGDLETLGTHKYLSSFQRPLWRPPQELCIGVDQGYRLQRSRYAQDLDMPLSSDPRALPPLSDEPAFIYGSKPDPHQAHIAQKNSNHSGRGRLASGASHAPIISEHERPRLMRAKQDLFTPNAPSETSLRLKSTSLDLPRDERREDRVNVHEPHHEGEAQKTLTSPEVESVVRTNTGVNSTASPEMNQPQFELRPYQLDAVNAILRARRAHVKRMVVCLPTGAGKTVIFSHLASIARRRVLVLAHREELLTQAQDKLQRTLGAHVRVEIEQAQKHASASAKVVVASLRSLRPERLNRLMSEEGFGLVIYDECHHAVAEDNQRVLRALGAFDDDFEGTLVGFTATTRRGDGIGLEEVFEELVYSRGLQEMITDGYLVPLRGYRISTHTSLEGLGGQGDFPLEALEERVDIQERNGLVARTIQELARDRRTICFCVTVNHADNLSQTLRRCGVPAAVIHGEMKGSERASVLRDFRRGTLQVLTNVGVLTEGFDDPEVSCIAMARPTRSESLYVQCVGRGMRLFKEKQDCLVIDFVDLSALNLITLPTLYGVPVELDFEGREAGEAAAAYHAILQEAPGFEWEAESLTLTELKERALTFDPLRLRVSSEVRAISQSGWVSLGQRGLALHFSRDGQGFAELVILHTHDAGKRRYRIMLDGEEVGRSALIEHAVEAADYEVGCMGHIAMDTASMYAEWRQMAPPPELLASLKSYPLPRLPETLEDVFRVLTFYQYL